MHRPLGRATLLARAPFSLAVARLHSTLAGPLAHLPAWAGGHAGVRFGFSCLPHFGWGQNAANTLRSLPRKNLELRSPFYIAAAKKNFKRYLIFAQSSSPPPAA